MKVRLRVQRDLYYTTTLILLITTVGLGLLCVWQNLTIDTLRSSQRRLIGEQAQSMSMDEVMTLVSHVTANRHILSSEPNLPPIMIAESDDESGDYLGRGRVSWFGGPNDDSSSAGGRTAITGEHPDELDPNDNYVAYRWDYDRFPRSVLQRSMVRLRAENGNVIYARAVDYGPHPSHNRLYDISPGAMRALGVSTDDYVEGWLVLSGSS